MMNNDQVKKHWKKEKNLVSSLRTAEIWAGEIALSWLGCKLKNGEKEKIPNLNETQKWIWWTCNGVAEESEALPFPTPLNCGITK